ncbi:oligopeptide/dipeptide ABC transporter ATP-binding protein [Thermovibrio sp.]
MESLVEVRKVEKLYPLKRDFFGRVKEFIRALGGVSLEVRKGKTVGVIGESGCGKSTLGKVILDLERPTSGEVLYKGKEISSLKGSEYKKYRRSVQAVFQNPQSSLNPRMKVWEVVSEGLKINFSLKKRELLERARELLKLVNLPENSLFKYPHQLSGGQKQRVAIARAVALKPELVVADEPTSALDVSVQAQIVNLFLELQEKFNLSYLFITHSIPVVEAVSDRVIVMYKGFIVEEGKSMEVLKERAHPYTKLLISSVPGVKEEFKEVRREVKVERGCPFYPRCPYGRKECLEFKMGLFSLSQTHKVACLVYS